MAVDKDDQKEAPTDARPIVLKPGRYLAPDLETGAEHPTRKGWFATGYIDKNGNPLWWRPPGRVSVWMRRISLAVLWFAGLVFAFAILMERFTR